jgi:hypothetical protein
MSNGAFSKARLRRMHDVMDGYVERGLDTSTAMAGGSAYPSSPSALTCRGRSENSGGTAAWELPGIQIPRRIWLQYF